MSKNRNWSLEQIDVASPCEVPWESMSGNERVRDCAQCKMKVFNISEMSRTEAESLVERSLKGEKICAQFYRRSDGTILTKDCPVGKKKVFVKKAKRGSWALGLSVFLSFFYAAAKEKQKKERLNSGFMVVAPPINPKNQNEPIAKPDPEEMIRGDIAVEPIHPAQEPQEEKVHLRGKIIPRQGPSKDEQ